MDVAFFNSDGTPQPQISKILLKNKPAKKTKCGFCDRCSDSEAALLVDKRKKEVEYC